MFDTETVVAVDPAALVDVGAIDAAHRRTSELKTQLADAEAALPITRNAAVLSERAISAAILAGNSEAAEIAAEDAAAALKRAERKVGALHEALGTHMGVVVPGVLAAAHDSLVDFVFERLRARAAKFEELEAEHAKNDAGVREDIRLLSIASAAGNGLARAYVNTTRETARAPVLSHPVTVENSYQMGG